MEETVCSWCTRSSCGREKVVCGERERKRDSSIFTNTLPAVYVSPPHLVLSSQSGHGDSTKLIHAVWVSSNLKYVYFLRLPLLSSYYPSMLTRRVISLSFFFLFSLSETQCDNSGNADFECEFYRTSVSCIQR